MSTVFVNGTFDVLHLGHLALLEYAASLGSDLVVAIDTDERVRQLKGPGRPVNSQFERQRMLESLRWVDRVYCFDSDQALEDIIKSCQPVIMVKGSDYRGCKIIGSEYCQQVVFLERIDGYSTTEKIQSIVGR